MRIKAKSKTYKTGSPINVSLEGAVVVATDPTDKERPDAVALQEISPSSEGEVALTGGGQILYAEIGESVTAGDLAEIKGGVWNKHSGGASKACGRFLQSATYIAGAGVTAALLQRDF